MRRSLLVCALVFSSIADGFTQADNVTTVVLRNLTIIDGNGEAPLPNGTIVIRGGRIVAVSAIASQRRDEDDAQVLDLQGHYAIPGLVDSHVHLSLDANDPIRELQAAFRGGVTAVRDMGGDEMILKRLAERTRRDDIPEPRVYFATPVRGPAWSVAADGRSMPPGDRPALPIWIRHIVRDVSQIDALIERARDVGATGIKLYSDLPHDVLRALSERARRAGLRVWGHARVFPHRPGESVEAGVEVLSHSSQLAFEESNGPDNGDVYRLVSPYSAAVTKLMQTMRTRGVALEPTLLASFSTAGGRAIDPSRPGRIPSLAWACQVTRRAHDLGVTLVAGTDRLNARGSRCPNIHTELELLVSYGGLTPIEAITAATRTAARVLGNDEVSGTIAAGKRADLTILSADPSKDIRNTRKVAFVLKAGRLYSVDGKRAGAQLLFDPSTVRR